MKTNHTPLPWSINPRSNTTVCDRNERSVAACGVRSDLSIPDLHLELASNAAFIVRCCNSHYELVSALQSIEERANYLSHMSMPAVSLTSIAEQARAALALAKGE